MSTEKDNNAVELFLMQQIKDLQAEVTDLRNQRIAAVLVEEPKVTPTKRYAVSTAKDRAKADDKLNAETKKPAPTTNGCSTFFGIVLTLLVMFFIVGLFAQEAGWSGLADLKGAVGIDEPMVTLSEFNRISTGMSYGEACSVIGASGEVMSETEFMGIKTVMYVWSNGIANMNAMFQNNELVSKAQLGLR